MTTLLLSRPRALSHSLSLRVLPQSGFASRWQSSVPQDDGGTHEAPSHWLDQRFPGLRQWLDRKNRTWWLKGIQARCREYPQLQGQESYVALLVERAYTDLAAKHKHLSIDSRSQTHLQVACLVLATQKVMQPYLRDSREVARILHAHMGDHTSPVLRFLLRSTLFLSRDPYALALRRLKALQLDYGKAFQSQLNLTSDRSAELQIDRCFYADIFNAEDASELLSTCCCSQDKVWFDTLDSRGVTFQQSSWIGHDASKCCRLQIRKAAS
ncbi:hypothetical protein WJX73_006470 [Symbiochloris irregularis]|uniref:Uncharacterized protein n=1 Tax=Symbiochloris irregularis TaxID=706552 RepID=A0AAW1PLH0_9CHLO